MNNKAKSLQMKKEVYSEHSFINEFTPETAREKVGRKHSSKNLANVQTFFIHSHRVMTNSLLEKSSSIKKNEIFFECTHSRAV